MKQLTPDEEKALSYMIMKEMICAKKKMDNCKDEACVKFYTKYFRSLDSLSKKIIGKDKV